MSALGSSKGGKARANTMTPEERSEVARNAVRARWAKVGKLKEVDPQIKPPTAVPATPVQEGEILPFSMFPGNLHIGNMEVECHVLNDGRRVFTQRAIVGVLTGGRKSGDLKVYLSSNPLIGKAFLVDDAIRFRIPGINTVAYGSEAMRLIEICEKYLQAYDEGKLKKNQIKLAVQSQIIIRACAKIGIIALVDEATGYQQFREKRALQLKLQAFIAEELQDWARMFRLNFGMN